MLSRNTFQISNTIISLISNPFINIIIFYFVLLKSLLKPLKLQSFRPIQLLNTFRVKNTNYGSKTFVCLTKRWGFNSYRCHILRDYCDFSTSSPSPPHTASYAPTAASYREKLGHIKMFPLREQRVENPPLKIHQPSRPVRSVVNNLYLPAISLFFHQSPPGPPVSDTFLSSIKLWGQYRYELHTSSQTRDEGIISVIYLKSLL